MKFIIDPSSGHVKTVERWNAPSGVAITQTKHGERVQMERRVLAEVKRSAEQIDIVLYHEKMPEINNNFFDVLVTIKSDRIIFCRGRNSEAIDLRDEKTLEEVWPTGFSELLMVLLVIERYLKTKERPIDLGFSRFIAAALATLRSGAPVLSLSNRSAGNSSG